MKNSRVSMQIRIDEDIYKPLKVISEYEMRSFNAQLEYFLREAVKEYISRNKNIEQLLKEAEKQ